MAVKKIEVLSGPLIDVAVRSTAAARHCGKRYDEPRKDLSYNSAKEEWLLLSHAAWEVFGALVITLDQQTITLLSIWILMCASGSR